MRLAPSSPDEPAAVSETAASAELEAQPLVRSASERDNFLPDCALPSITIVVLGASGDLAKKKTFPALYALFSKG